MTEFKPCPFCGKSRLTVGKISYSADGFAYCVECECTARGAWAETKEQAVAAWNTRHEETCEVKELETIAQTLAMARWLSWGECSECGCLTPVDSTFCIYCGRRVV